MVSQEVKVAVLENRVSRLEARLKTIDESLKGIVEMLAHISGGKKALWGLCALIGMGIAAIVGVITIAKVFLAKFAGG